ncbi:MAG: molybdate ABC transporter substrate-binding protein [Phycisphaerales bacterium]
MSRAAPCPRFALLLVSARRGWILSSLLLVNLALGCEGASSSDDPEVEVLVSVAASMSDAIAAIAAEFEASEPGAEIAINVGSSGELARQIARGAEVDLYIAADPAWIDWLIDQKAPAGDRRAFAGNRLALVTTSSRADSLRSIADLVASDIKRIAIGQPETSPAGRYAMRELERRGVADAVAERFILTDHVRQALVYLERGEADAAFVYETDVRDASSLHIVERFALPERMYEALALDRDDASDASSGRRLMRDRFVEHLHSAAATRILREHGFVVD